MTKEECVWKRVRQKILEGEKMSRVLLTASFLFLVCMTGCDRSTTSQKVRVVDSVFEYNLLFSSTQTGNNEIYIYSIKKGEMRNISNHPSADQDPAWSKIRQKVAFVSNRNGSNDIFEMNLDGTNQQLLVGEKDHQVFPSYSNNGTRLAYCLNETGGWWLYILDICSGVKTKLVCTPFASPPTWSPDDKKITFEGLKERGDHQEIMVIDIDGSNEHQLTNTIGASVHPVFSPNGKQIAFSSKRDGKESLFIMGSDGMSQKNLTSRGFILNGGGIDLWPSWAPNGDIIAYYSSEYGTKKIRLIEISSGHIETLIEKDVGDSRPVWVAIASE